MSFAYLLTVVLARVGESVWSVHIERGLKGTERARHEIVSDGPGGVVVVVAGLVKEVSEFLFRVGYGEEHVGIFDEYDEVLDLAQVRVGRAQFVGADCIWLINYILSAREGCERETEGGEEYVEWFHRVF